MRASCFISLSIALAAAMPAAAQVSSGNVFVSASETAIPVQINKARNTVTNRVVEPVTPSFDSLISAPVQYDKNGVAKAQYFKASDLTPAQNEAFQEEVRRVRNYQSVNGANTTLPDYIENDKTAYGSSYETGTYSTSNAPAASSTGLYELELYTPQSQPAQSIAATPQNQANAVHNVAKGDTLYNISKRYNVTVGAIQDINGLSGTNLSLGQSLRIPSTNVRAEYTSQAQPIFVSTPVRDGAVTRRIVNPIATSSRPVSTYAVLKKDTLYSIAKRSCVSVNDLASQNGISDPSDLQLGQQLKLPLGHCLPR